MRFRRLLALAAILLAVLIVFVWVRHHRSDDAAADASVQPPTVSVVTAHTGFIANQLTVAGVFQPFQEIDVHGKVSGYIRHIYVDIGDRVHQGQTLAVLEVPELQAEVAGAQAGLRKQNKTFHDCRRKSPVSRPATQLCMPTTSA